MTFRELLEKYKNHTATTEERKQVEAELEKYNALTEYCWNRMWTWKGKIWLGSRRNCKKSTAP